MSLFWNDIKGPDLKAINLELTSHCNLRCTYCLNPHDDFRKKGYVSRRLVEKVVSDLPDSTKIMICGIGEPSLHPEFNWILTCLSEKFKKISIVTNGHLFFKKENIDLVAKLNIEKIFLSLDYISASDYVNYKKGKVGDIDEIFKGIKYFNRVKSNNCFMQINYLFDGQKKVSSYLECYEKVKLVLEKDWCIYIRKIKNLAGQVETDLSLIEDSENYLDEIFKDYICSEFMVENWDRLLAGTNHKKDNTRICRHIYSYYMLLWNGDVVPCCQDFNAKMKLLNVIEDEMDLYDLFYGNQYQEFRKSNERANFKNFPLCSRCEDYYKA